MSQVRKVLVALAFVTVSLTACNKDGSTTGAPAQEAMGLYAKGFNALINDPKAMIKEYFSNIPEAGPDGKERLRLFSRQTFAARGIKEAREAFDAAKSAAPESMAGLAPAADQAIAAIEKIETAFTAAQKYYEAESYKDDGLAKGKELHAQMLAATKDFHAALGKLEKGLSSIEDEQAVKELAKYEGDKDYGYWFRFYNMQAKKFLAAVEAASSPEELKGLEAAFQPIASANDALGKFVASKSGKVNTTFNSYANHAGSFHATAIKLVRMVKDAKLDGVAVDQATEALVRNYNTLVNMANALYDVEATNALN